MVQLASSQGNLRPGPETVSFRDNSPVKSEIEDPLQDEHGHLNKRRKSSSLHFNQTGSNDFGISPSQYNPLDEPSPLGLRLRKSPSLLELIQMRLSQSNASSSSAEPSVNLDSGNKKDAKSSAAFDKLKASNFTASLLRIGTWEYLSRHEGDLVAKCYFAKHKLVWEVLDGGLKSKIEIQWSDIMAMKASSPDNGPGTLTVVLARPPLFFRETNPQPRKHTLWQATADFTDGQASTHRQHFLQCPQGLLNKHYEKLIQCDARLNYLSRQPELVLDSPYFAPAQGSVFEGPDELRGHGFSQLETTKGSPASAFQNVASPPVAQSSSLKIEQWSPLRISPERLSKEDRSPSSVTEVCSIEGNKNCEVSSFQVPKNWEQLKVSGLPSSMSMSDLVNHLEHCISEQRTLKNLPFAEKSSENQYMIENIAQILFSDNQTTAASDEKSLMSRVNSLCCLLQDPPAAGPNERGDGKTVFDPLHENKAKCDIVEREVGSEDVSGGKRAMGMSRKDSFSELLLHLPRIASLPRFLCDISEDGEGEARQ